MHLIKFNKERYINPDDIRQIFVEGTSVFIQIGESYVSKHRYDSYEDALEGMRYLIEFLHTGGTDLVEYRELDGFENEVWSTYCKINRNMRERLMARCMLILSDPDALLLMKPADVSSMLLEHGMPWYSYDSIVGFQQFLEGNVEKHPEWFEMRE